MGFWDARHKLTTKRLLPPSPRPSTPVPFNGDAFSGHRYQAKTEAKRLLSVMLVIPRWSNSLNFSSKEALSLAAALIEEEASALTARPARPWAEVGYERSLHMVHRAHRR